MKKEIITLIALGASMWGLSSCETPEEKAKRLAVEELMSLNIAAPQYDAQLVTEAAKGSVKRMQLLLTAGADVNTPDTEGKTALIAAIDSRNPEAVNLLLNAGANIHAKNAKGETALHIAAARGLERVIGILLAKGANVNETDASGQCPLHAAMVSQNIDLLQTLIDAGADVNAADASGNTPLHLAVKTGNTVLVAQMLENGADCNKENAKGLSALGISVQSGYKAISLQLIQAGAKKDIADADGNTLLMLACQNEHTAILDMLLKDVVNGTSLDINAVNNDGASAVHLALSNKSAVKSLMTAGANINISDKKGHTPLELAVRQGLVEIVRLLLDAEPALSSATSSDNLPIIALAAESGKTEIVKMLLDAGAEANVMFKNNGCNVNTLTYARSGEVKSLLKQAGCIEIISTDQAVELLLRYDIIDLYAKGEMIEVPDFWTNRYVSKYDDSYSETSEEFLYNYKLYKDGQKSIKDYRYITTIYGLWEKSKRKKHLPKECIMAFIAAGASVNGNESSALAYSINNDHFDITRALLAAGANPSHKSDPLYFAAKKQDHEHLSIIKDIINNPQFSAENSDALVRAAAMGYTEIVKLLLTAPGIDVNRKCKRSDSDIWSGDTALKKALNRGHTKIVELLKTAGAKI